MELGKRIKYVRQLRGLTQTELAEKVGLPADENGRIRISQYENGTRVPKKDMQLKISEALNVKSRYLVNEHFDGVSELAYSLFELDNVLNPIIETYDNDEYEESYCIKFDTDYCNFFWRDWALKKKELAEKKITKQEYDEWKIQYKKLDLPLNDINKNEDAN